MKENFSHSVSCCKNVKAHSLYVNVFLLFLYEISLSQKNKIKQKRTCPGFIRTRAYLLMTVQKKNITKHYIEKKQHSYLQTNAKSSYVEKYEGKNKLNTFSSLLCSLHLHTTSSCHMLLWFSDFQFWQIFP